MRPSPASGEAKRRRIGVDLDNTICDYTAVFGPIAVELGLAPASMRSASKQEIRAHLRASEGGETAWMRLQGQVYGRHLPLAKPYPGAFEAIGRFISRGAAVCIVSHKTRRGHFDPNGVDLWLAAQDWLTANGLNEAGLTLGEVHFLETREEKLRRIADLGCDVFIDDLPEVLLHPDFPQGAMPIWFTGAGMDANADARLTPHVTWEQVERSASAALSRP